ncbi:MAG: ABC transporter ATP-binding protein [Lachnospiraceae bacterium]|nr:ABC transporter ATP-binding protein [Lachnospiraceae bacterium]
MQEYPPILECHTLRKVYDAQPALQGISFAVAQGRILGLLGPNGSGKTTLIKLAAGLLKPTAGEILIGGRKPGLDSKRVVSYLPDRNFLDGDMTFHDACRMFRSFFEDFDEARAQRMLSDLGIDPKKRFKTLSKGNREKVQLILVMSRQSWLYLLDEPIAGVDPATRDYILNTIIQNRNPQATVIISTHLIADVEQVLDDVLFLKDGMVALYNSAEAVRKENGKSVDEVFREIYAYHPQMNMPYA